LDELVLVHLTEDITAGDGVSFAELDRGEFPELGLTKAGDVDTTGDEKVLCELRNFFERTLDTIENVLHNAGAKFYRERLLLTENRVTNGQTGCAQKKTAVILSDGWA
jgi:hypothetical protein